MNEATLDQRFDRGYEPLSTLLHEIKPGIYSFFEADYKNHGILAVTVHLLDKPYTTDGDRKNLESFILNHDGSIINTVQPQSLESTAEFYLSLGRTQDVYFVVTNKMNWDPLEISWDDVIEFIRRFSQNEILLLGGFLLVYHSGWTDEGEPGCLPQTAAILESQGNLSPKILHHLSY